MAEGGNIPAAIAAADGGGITPDAGAGDLLLSRLLFLGIFILTYNNVYIAVVLHTKKIKIVKYTCGSLFKKGS